MEWARTQGPLPSRTTGQVVGETLKGCENVKLSRKLALTLRVASMIALGAALVPILSTPAAGLGGLSTTPPSGTVTVPNSASYSITLTTTGDGSAVTYTQDGSGQSPELHIDPSTGKITTTSTLATETYSISGETADDNDTGTWSFTLTVTAGTLSTLPTTGTVSVPGSSGFTVPLVTTGNYGGGVTYSQGASNQSPDLSFSTSAAEISATNTLAVGNYTISGATTDPDGDAGSWSYTLAVTAGSLGTSPTTGTVSVPGSSAFTVSLVTTGNYGGGVTYSQGASNQSPDLSFSTSAAEISATNTLAVGNYTISGATTDPDGDAGSWSYTLAVTPVAITQTAPFLNSTTPTRSSSFTATLTTTGNTGAVGFTTTTAPPGSTGGIKVSRAGVVTTTGALSVGTYAASGTDSDSYGDTGTWSYSLKVSPTAITQLAPTTGTTTTGKSFTGQLKISGSHGTVTYAQSTGAPHLTVSSSGKVSAPATLVAGTYKATGTLKDASGDSGTWSYSLTVTASKIAQLAPTTGTTTFGKVFTGQLEVSGSHGTVTYTQSTGAPHLTVSSSGKVSAAATLAAGTYRVTGTVKDTSGDTGSWTFDLTVTASKIAQVAPTTATTTFGKVFSGQLEVSGSHGTVTFTESTGGPHLTVSSSGKVSAAATLVAGTYKATGTVKDTSGDTGTWSFALTVTTNKIVQDAPTAARTPTGKAFNDQLKVTGSSGNVTYAQSTGAPNLTVSSSGKVSAAATLAAGAYKATGSARDTLGDTGTWSFALAVTATKITQVAPATARTPTGRAFTGQLKVSGSHGTVTYAQSTGAPRVKLSSSGKISVAATLAAGAYKATGSARDSLGDTGTWSFALAVTATRITQIAPTAARTPTGKAFSSQLELSGAHGNVTYAQSTGAPNLTVSSSGKVSAAATLAAGAYKATGSARDTLGDTGTWSFALAVTATKITQVAPATARTPTGRAFTGQLKVSGSHGTVTYAQSTGAPRVKLSSSGKISVAATLVAGTCKATGTARDTLGDTGTWSFALTVVATKLSQVAPTSATSTAGKAFTGQLKVSGSHGAVTYAQSTGALDLRVSSSGKISVAATLVAGTYKATGTARDTLGDTGTWSFALRVVATKLTQVAPDTAVNRAGKAFTGQLRVSGSHGTVTYAQSAGAPHLKVSSSGKISAAAGLAAGIYKAKGTAKDTYGATGTWTFALTVKGSKLTQIAPTTGTTTAGKAFTVKLGVSGSHGTVTFIQSSTGAQILTVLPSGTLLAPDIYTPGTYKITGTVKDSLGDIGTWSFTLTVEAAALPQDLQAAKGPSAEMRVSAV